MACVQARARNEPQAPWRRLEDDSRDPQTRAHCDDGGHLRQGSQRASCRSNGTLREARRRGTEEAAKNRLRIDLFCSKSAANYLGCTAGFQLNSRRIKGLAW